MYLFVCLFVFIENNPATTTINNTDYLTTVIYSPSIPTVICDESNGCVGGTSVEAITEVYHNETTTADDVMILTTTRQRKGNLLLLSVRDPPAAHVKSVDI